MPLIKIEHHHIHHHHDAAVRSPDPHLIWNKRTELLANFLMSIAYVTATVFLGAAASLFITMATSQVPPRILYPDTLAWIISSFGLVAALAYAGGHFVLGKLRQ